MNRKCEQSVERRTFTKGLGADIDKVYPEQTLGNTRGNNNKDAMFDRTAVRVKINVVVIFM